MADGVRTAVSADAAEQRPGVGAERLPTLLLFDIDGTLLQKASREHAAVLHQALRAVHGVDARALKMPVTAAGRTDGEIARALLTAVGIAEAEIDAGAGAVRDECCRLYAKRCGVEEGPGASFPTSGVAPRPPSVDLREHVVPGMPALLESLTARDGVVLGLVTGNYEQVARAKLAVAGLLSFFDPWLGGFGSDSENRVDLPRIARRRAASVIGRPHADAWPQTATIVIGDTPRDIACARADGLRVIAVTTGPYAADELSAADAVATDCTELAAALSAMLGEDIRFADKQPSTSVCRPRQV